jgi:type 2 lantibiotic biosynthesis protein LanM
VDERLDRIAAGAATLWEWLARQHTLDAERIKKWSLRAASGDSAQFEKRLSWLGETVPVVSPPEWLELFHHAMAELPGNSPQPSRFPFGAILHSFVGAAQTRLSAACGRVFSDQVLDSLRDALLQELTYIAGPPLYLEFAVFRSSWTGAIYESFVARMLAGGLWSFFSEYPALARLLSTMAGYWARNVSELASFLEEDLSEIEKVFNGSRPAGHLIAVRTSLSDSHDENRTVAILEFESGLKIVYKPRNLGIEKEWFTLLAYLNARGGDFLTLKVIDRSNRGWVELVERAPCRDSVEARQYYTRAGMLLAVLYALEASDCFYENVIACGAHPVLVDMETLMHHVLRQTGELTPSEAAADDILFDSVFRAGFLPSWESGAKGMAVDISGLGAKAGQITPYVRRSWENINRDDMKLIHEPIRVDTEDHLPELNGRSLNASDYVEEIVTGFRSMYAVLMELSTELTAQAGPLDRLGRSEIRLVFHATRIYGLLLKRLAAPCYLRSGIERSIETDIISRFYLESPQKARFHAILEAEIQAIERLDIPRFAVRGDSRDLHLPTGRMVENAFEETALDRVRRRVRSLSERDRDLQTGLIRASLSMSAIEVHSGEPALSGGSSAGSTPASIEELEAEASRLAALIASRAILASDGGATWIAPQLLPGATHYQLRPLRMDIYNGLAGIALFFAALDRITGKGRDNARMALLPLQQFIAAANPRRLAAENYTIGGATGTGSIVYALTRCATFLEDPGLLECAETASRWISPESLAADDLFDVMSGSAGAILALLMLFAQTESEATLRTAILCGDHLLAKQEPAPTGAAWRTGHAKFMTGLSHGAAGIALALLRLAAATGHGRFEEAALKAIAFENSTFDRAEGNWPDFRYATPTSPAFMTTWCHGGPGIGMARASSLPLLDTAEVRADICAALGSVSASGIGAKDGLCCGSLGRAELLLLADRNGSSALQLASAVIAKSRRAGGYSTSGKAGLEFFDPSFFQGLSGIGYQLLRIAHPDELPGVLVWE